MAARGGVRVLSGTGGAIPRTETRPGEFVASLTIKVWPSYVVSVAGGMTAGVECIVESAAGVMVTLI